MNELSKVSYFNKALRYFLVRIMIILIYPCFLTLFSINKYLSKK